LKDFLKDFWWPFRLSKLVKYSQSYSLNKICDRLNIYLIVEDTKCYEKNKS